MSKKDATATAEKQYRVLIGISIDKPHRRFEPGQPASGDGRYGGSGLGLAIARSIARAHGGELYLRNGADGGLEVEIKLPRP